ncbi:Ankyrin repeat [Succinivibrio dextrinosolvens]|uniref:ankyrin repeat domain-containing protein n=1 Tax=Succinivibrio dextrinosolvens TaxID=83771 RepID=UPI0008E4A65D|nr:ankyrin repeat domain-containing protein [Succinivibrio dextrinosolvens]SFS36366.1 Ankyrin repeat [Succinivibrio dextrinosolvens]
MKNLNRSLINLAVVGCIAIFSESVIASSYELEATGKDEAAALGNLKMAALRAEVQKTLSKDEMKQNAKLLRNEVFLKVNDFTHESGTPAYSTENNKVKVKGSIEVDSDKLLSVLGKAPLVKEGAVKADTSDTKSEVQIAQNTALNPVSSQTEDALSISNSEKTDSSGSKGDFAAENIPDSTVQTRQTNVSEEISQRGSDSNSVSPESAAGFEVLKVAHVSASEEENQKFRQKTLTGFTKIEEIESFIKSGCDPNVLGTRDFGSKKSAKVPLLFSYVAWKQAQVEVVKLLCESGAWYNWQNEEGTLCIASEILNSKEEIINYWLSLKPDLKRLKMINFYNGNQENLLRNWLDRRDSKDIKDHLGIFKKLLELGADPNVSLNLEPLIWTVYEKTGSEYAKAMLEKGADPNAYIGTNGSFPRQVLKDNDEVLLDSMIAHGLNVKETPTDGKGLLNNYLHMFYRWRDNKPTAQIVKKLVEAGADYNWESDDGSSSIAESVVSTKDYDIVEYWLSLNPDLKKLKSYESLKVSLLDRLLSFKNVEDQRNKELFKKLLQIGCDPNGLVRGRYPILKEAYETGGVDYAKLLLDSGADANIVDYYKDPLIFYANENKDLNLLKLLKEYKADVNAFNHRQESMLLSAISDNSVSLEYIQGLLDLGCDVNVADKRGITPLMKAVSDYSEKNEKIVDELLNGGADVNAVSDKKRTALIYAISQPETPSISVIDKLLSKGANIDAQDEDGATALTFAMSTGDIDIVKHLIDKKADVNLALSPSTKIKNKDGQYEEKTLKQILKETDNESVKELKIVLKKYL